MANASDPLLEMFTTDVDEKAVSELVGSLESRLSRQRPTVLNSHAQQAQQHPQQQQQQQPPDRGGGRLGAAAAAGGGASKAAAPDLGEAEARSGALGPTMKRTAATGILLLHQQQQQYQQLQQQQVGETNCQRHGGVVAPGVSVAASSAASVAAALPSSLSASSASSLSSTSSLLSAAASSSSSSSSSASLSSPSTSLTQASSLTQSSLSPAASTCSSSSFSSQSSSVSAPASSSSSTTTASLSNHADVPVLPLGRTPVTQTVGSAGQPLNGGFVYGTPAGGGGGAVVGGGVGVVSPARTSSISSGGNSNNGVALSVVAVDSGRMNFNVTASTNLNPNVAPNPIITATTTIITTTASTNPSVTSTNPNAATTAATSNPALTPCPGAGTPPTIALQRPPASHNGAPNSIVSTSSIISTSSSSNISSSNSTGHPPLMCTTPAGVVSGQPSVISAVASRPAITLISSQQQQQQQAAIVPTLAPSVAGMVPLAGGHSGMVRVSVPPPPSPGPALSPARPGLALQQRLLPPQIIAPRPQTIQLPPGFTLPPGTVMVRAGEQGQLFLIQQSVLAQAGGAAPHAAPVPPSSTVAHAPSPPAASPATQPQQGVRLAALQIAPVTPPVGGAPTLAAATPAPPAVPALPTSQPPLVFTPEVMENVKKCKNFLSTLIKLASSGQQSPETTRNVKELVQNLLDAKMEPEEFTSRLQKELKSSPQPYLVPFLKKSLPAVRYLAQNPQAPTQAVPQLNAIGTPTTSTSAARPLGVQTHAAQAPLHTVLTTQHGGGVKQIVLQSQARGSTQIKPGTVVRAQGPALIRPPPTGVPGATGLQASASQKGKMKDLGGGTFKDDDDINDVASMAGVNINEESARIAATGSDTVGTQIRSCRDEAFLSAGPLQRRLLDIGRRYGVTEVPADVVGLVSHAAQERLKNLVERLSVIAQHRTETYRDSDDSEQMSDVRSQLRFFEQLDRLEKQRKDEQEREILLRAAKSRSRQEDPEQARLKQKAKEMQQAELAQMRQREANLTALAAIGPRKKRKLDSPGPGTPGEAGGGGPGASSSGGAVSAGGSDGGAAAAVAGPGGGGGGGGGGVPGTPTRPSQRARFTRVNLRDLIFLLEQDRETAHSLVLYRAQLK